MRNVLALPLVLTACHVSALEADLGDALRAGQVNLFVSGLGGHAGYCVRVEALNRTAGHMRITIPSGWRFTSRDSALQDLLVVGDHVLALAPDARSSLICRAFCCEAGMGGPGPGSAFDEGALADSALVRLARHLVSERCGDQAMQQAIWAVSDGIPISAIDADDAAVTNALRRYVSSLTGRAVPWYTTTFLQAGSGRAFNPNPARVTGRVDFLQRDAGVLSIVVKDAAGRTVHVLDEGRELRQGSYSIDVEVTVRGWAHGRYSICFATDGVLLKKEEFEL